VIDLDMAFYDNDGLILHVIFSVFFFNAARPGSRRTHESTSRLLTDPVILNNDLMLGPLFNMEDPDLHYVYVCIKVYIAVSSFLFLSGLTNSSQLVGNQNFPIAPFSHWACSVCGIHMTTERYSFPRILLILIVGHSMAAHHLRLLNGLDI